MDQSYLIAGRSRRQRKCEVLDWANHLIPLPLPFPVLFRRRLSFAFQVHASSYRLPWPENRQRRRVPTEPKVLLPPALSPLSNCWAISEAQSLPPAHNTSGHNINYVRTGGWVGETVRAFNRIL